MIFLIVVLSIQICIFDCFGSDQKPKVRFEQPRPVTIQYPISANFDTEDRYYEEFGTGNENAGLFPNIFNLATNALITANATCGEKGPESYCKLVEHVYMRSPQCNICDGSSLQRRHPIEFAVDGSNRWWQSPSLATGIHFERITITLDLRQQYQVAYVIIKAAIAPRPGNWILERSLDGINWKAWQYYAITDEECERAYGIKATPGGQHRFQTDDHVICTSYYSRLDPLIDGEIHTSLVNGRPGVDGPSLELQEFTKARFVRLRLQRIRTLNSDLMFITRRKHHVVIDESVTRRYFYAIRDISIGGQCICYGHAESCPADPATGQLKCECKHNTCGESCNECCPLFNQKAWKPGTTTQHHACEPCQCFNHSDRCIFDQEIENKHASLTPDGLNEGGGVCLDCKHHTTGVNCQECEDKYFRPAGMSHYLPDACKPCQCDPEGSVDEQCIRDETRATENLRPGDCRCKHGFGGARCDQCALGFRNYPTCDPCPCNRAGSANFAICDGTCVCKANVEGEFCDRCKPGYYNLNERNPDGCTKCFCFGLSNECNELAWGKYQIRETNGWLLSDIDFTRESNLTNLTVNHVLMVNVKEVTDRSLFYWKAPKAFLGNKLTSYGGYISYVVYYVVEGQGVSMHLPDIILKNGDTVIEYHSGRTFSERENASMIVKMHESSSWYDRYTRRPATKEQLMTVLTNIQVFAIRATYHQAQLFSIIYGLTMDSARSDSASQDLVYSSEKCTCPPLFTGTSCESCVSGYRRLNNVLLNGKCVACHCNGHSDTCDPYTGSCNSCTGNTMGEHCELCSAGYYGNPALGTDSSCKPCACPLLDKVNNFSPTCALVASDTSMSDYVCTACPVGYMGNKCEWCTDGYFGSPSTPEDYCRPCQCNNNVDPAAIGNCDRTNGRCLKCIGNTAGWHCELCKADFYGDALLHNCKACSCNMFGSLKSQCDLTSGQCTCKPNYIGEKCDKCLEGYGDIENDCQPCNCHVMGAASDSCDQVSGQCQCKPGVFGKRCDTCLSGYYGFGHNGCDYCNCYPSGSIDDGKCDLISGQCLCRQHVTGEKCNLCDEGYFNITSGSGCQPCACHSEGSDGITCDQINGQCSCKPGVTGVHCAQCKPNFYGLSNDGCKQCPVCPAAGHICDPVTGRCVCPPYTVGDMCESCAPNTWDYDAYKGCKTCDCDTSGSVDASCDLTSGLCKCRVGYTGKKCDQCTHGHYKFPSCFKCNCNAPGTNELTCVAQNGCSCDEKGQCNCKKNVIGEKCNDCSATSFSLEADNPSGCTECFCFNRTKFCIQSSFIWRQVTSEKRTVSFDQPWASVEKRFGLNVLPLEPSSLNVRNFESSQLYWSLPAQFLGDKVTSYNGYLRFRIINKNRDHFRSYSRPDERIFERYPMVVLVGNHRIVMEHYKSSSEISEDGVYFVKLREDAWKNRHKSGKHVDRQTMMVALQNLQAIFVRATFIENVNEASLLDASMDIGISEDTSVTLSRTSIGVEACDCPGGYSGSSCQNPAEGFCRKKISNYLDSENDLDLVGSVVPCSCHSHSNTCDSETCRCTDCQHNTSGDFCEYCAPGFYGNSKHGTEHDCQKCACPTEQHSFSKSCYATTHNAYGYVCDQCQEGHSGDRCETCVSGYFGDPISSGKPCRKCACNKYGSVSDTCDRVNGQCSCRAEVTGRDCSECRPRYALIGSHCTSCDQGCTKELMSSMDDLDLLIESYNFTGLVPAPWGRLAKIKNFTTDTQQFIDNLSQENETLHNRVSANLTYAKKRLTDAQKVFDETKYINESRQTFMDKADGLIESGYDILGEIDNIWSKIHRNHAFFVRYKTSGSTKHTDTPVLAEKFVTEANELIQTIRRNEDDFNKRISLTEQALKDGLELLEQVKAKIFNDTVTKQMAEVIANLSDKLNDAKRVIWEDVRRNCTNAENILKITEKMLLEFERLSTNINDVARDSSNLLANATIGVERAKSQLLDTHDYYTDAKQVLVDQVKNGTTECDMRANQFEQFLPEYQQTYLIPARRHADDLFASAERINDLFAPTRLRAESPVNASSAYAHIKRGIEDATQEADKAMKSAQIAYNRVFEDSGDFTHQSKNSLNTSSTLLGSAGSLQTKKLAGDLEQFRMRLNRVQENDLNTRKFTAEVGRKFQRFDDSSDKVEDIAKEVNDVKIKSDTLLSATQSLYNTVDEIHSRAESANSLTGKSLSILSNDVQNVIQEVQSATGKMTTLQKLGPTTDLKIQEIADSVALLKEKIKEAREKASMVRLSVKSKEPDTCLRTYLSPAVPSPANSLYIEYRPTDDVADSLIFITKTNQTRTRPTEFLALELRDRRFVFIWNVGGGKNAFKQVTARQRIDSIARMSHTVWYKIDAERKGNFANLTVGVPIVETNDTNTYVTYKFSSQILPDDADDSADDSSSSTIFNSMPGLTKVSLGADRGQLPAGVQTARFRGIIGQVALDGTNVPLWNFVDDEGHCEPYYPSSQTEAPTSGYMFSDGYAQIPRLPGYNNLQTHVVIGFASYSENGLLYFRGNPATKDFLSIELEDGKIKTQINLGGGSRTKLITSSTYNDGKKYVVEVRRSHLNASLEITGTKDESLIQLIPGNFRGLEADTDNLLGGVPESYPKHLWRSFNIQWRGFYGCLSSPLKVDNRYLKFDNANKTLNVKPNCGLTLDPAGKSPDIPVLHSPDRVITFRGDGSFVVNGLALTPRHSNLGINFRTKGDNGLVFYQSSRVSTRRKRNSRAGSGFIAGYVLNCLFVLKLGTGSDDSILLSSTVKVCDGRLHTVFVKRRDLDIKLFIDDHFMALGSLKQNITIGSKKRSQLFLGGLGSTKYAQDELPNYLPFTGCVSDLYFGYKRVVLVPQRLEKATLGICIDPTNNLLISHQNDGGFVPHGIELFDGDTFMADQPLDIEQTQIDLASDSSSAYLDTYQTELAKSRMSRRVKSRRLKNKKELACDINQGGLPFAAYYGASENSHTFIKISNRRALSDHVSFQFRTESMNGTLMFWCDKYATQYVHIALYEGRLKTYVKLRKTGPPLSLDFAKKLNDRMWHTVEVNKHGRSLNISLNYGEESSEQKLPIKWSTKGARSSLTVGGIRRNFLLHSLMNESFVGCIRDFSLNNQRIDLIKQHKHGLVIKCHNNTESNLALLTGKSFITLKNVGAIGSAGLQELAFAVRFDALSSGRLFTLSNKNASALSVDFVKQKKIRLIYHHNAFNGSADLSVDALECGDQWHMLVLKFSSHKSELSFDNESLFLMMTSRIDQFDSITFGSHSDNRNSVLACFKGFSVNKGRWDFVEQNKAMHQAALNYCSD